MSALLKKLREDNGKDIPEISSATRIKECFLEAIENEQYDKLPLEIYARGYIKGYAKYLGFPTETALEPYERYLEMKSGLKGRKASVQSPDRPVAEIETEEQIKLRGITGRTPEHEEPEPWTIESVGPENVRVKRGRSRFIWIALVLFIVSGYVAYQYLSSDDVYKEKVNARKTVPARTEPKPADAPVKQEQPDPALQAPESQAKQGGQAVSAGQVNPPATSAASADPSAGTNASDEDRSKVTGNTVFTDGQTPNRKKHVLTFSAVEHTSVHLLIDGREKIEVTLDPGESRTYNAYRSITGTVGNGGGVRIKFNGKPLPQGQKGEPQKLNLPGN